MLYNLWVKDLSYLLFISAMVQVGLCYGSGWAVLYQLEMVCIIWNWSTLIGNCPLSFSSFLMAGW